MRPPSIDTSPLYGLWENLEPTPLYDFSKISTLNRGIRTMSDQWKMIGRALSRNYKIGCISMNWWNKLFLFLHTYTDSGNLKAASVFFFLGWGEGLYEFCQKWTLSLDSHDSIVCCEWIGELSWFFACW